ncbi:hypothetical protein CYY_001242 [Polysphondylium violaceum]|uniref:Purple acid phosphatase n=1 Tax=Polysphondylium violaceum TaxID=133409 RepID=A0A8J4Q3L0_9MYCE|nr:hypothetical protein CYY_001242 [Polysphondylium violaceum]
MDRKITIFIILAFVGIALADLDPHHVKLALTKQTDQYRVTWFTNDQGSSPSLLYSTNTFQPQSGAGSAAVFGVQGSVESFDTPHWNGHSNTAVMEGLSEWTTYYYSVGDKETASWSQVFNFSTRGFTQTPFKFAVYGDMGHGGVGIDRDENYTLSGVVQRESELDFVLHVGDIAYADLKLSTIIQGNETVWNEFLDIIQPVSSILPYMTCPGNHDIFYDFTVYRKTFFMPTDKPTQSWYSFDYGQVHFVSFSTEHDYFPLSSQYNWIENELKTYREKNPNGWLVVYAHRPMYCSVKWKWCKNKHESRKLFVKTFEKMFFRYNVDLYIAGHVHNYERSLPVYKGEVAGSYENPKGPVHITIGTGGNKEGPLHGWQEAPEWSEGIRFIGTGFGTINILNSTTLQFDFIGNEKNDVIDSFTLTKGDFFE